MTVNVNLEFDGASPNNSRLQKVLNDLATAIAALGTGAAGNPSLPLSSVQFNYAGVFDGDAAFTFDKANALLSTNGVANADITDWQGFLSFVVGPGSSGSGLGVIGGSVNDSSSLIFMHYGAGTITSPQIPVAGDNLGQIGFLGWNGTAYEGAYTYLLSIVGDNHSAKTKYQGANPAGFAWNVEIGSWPPVVLGKTSYADILTTGTADNADHNYSFWDDARGVFRIKDEDRFGDGIQAIPALYNPLFTKYMAGATDFERIICAQWNGNVAEIGTEAGGTGTLRPLVLLGPSVDATAYKVGGVPGANFGPAAVASITVVNGIITAIS